MQEGWEGGREAERSEGRSARKIGTGRRRLTNFNWRVGNMHEELWFELQVQLPAKVHHQREEEDLEGDDTDEEGEHESQHAGDPSRVLLLILQHLQRHINGIKLKAGDSNRNHLASRKGREVVNPLENHLNKEEFKGYIKKNRPQRAAEIRRSYSFREH